MELIEKILSEENLQKAIRKVKKNKGAIDGKGNWDVSK